MHHSMRARYMCSCAACAMHATHVHDTCAHASRRCPPYLAARAPVALFRLSHECHDPHVVCTGHGSKPDTAAAGRCGVVLQCPAAASCCSVRLAALRRPLPSVSKCDGCPQRGSSSVWAGAAGRLDSSLPHARRRPPALSIFIAPSLLIRVDQAVMPCHCPYAAGSPRGLAGDPGTRPPWSPRGPGRTDSRSLATTASGV